MESSDALDAIGAALAAATGELQNVVADSVNPHFRSRYASLPGMLDSVRPVLAKHGLAVVQFPVAHDDGRIGVETILMHASGQYLAGRIYVTPQKHDPQGAGSAITYCRRYGLAAVLSIGQDDDDANAASAPPPHERAHRAAPAAQRSAPAAPPPPPDWRDEKIGFGKFKDTTWREMAQGEIGGRRYSYCEWLGEETRKKLAEKPGDERGEKILERVTWALATMNNAADSAAEPF